MLKLSQKSLIKPKVFWPSIIVLLVASITFYILKEKEKTLMINTEEELTKTIDEKK